MFMLALLYFSCFMLALFFVVFFCLWGEEKGVGHAENQ